MGALKVHPLKIALLVLCVAVNWATSTQNQLINVDKDESKNHYRDGNLEPSFEVEPLKEGIRPAALVLRGLISFTTFTAVKSTTTVISTLTSTTTCTTSTAALTACSTSGRRRQSLQIDGFLYNENEGNGDGGRILPTTGKPALIPEPDFPSIARYPPYPPSASGSSSIPSPDVVSRPELPPQPPVEPVIAEPSPMTYGPATPSTRPPRPPYPTPFSLSPITVTSSRPPSPTQASSSMPYPPTVPVVAETQLRTTTPRPRGPSPPVNPSSLPPLPEIIPTVAEAPQLTHWKSDIRLPPAAQHSIPIYQPSAFEYPSASQPALSGIIEPSWLNDRDGLIQGRLGLMRLVAFGTSTVTSFSIKTTTVSLTAVCSRTTGFSTCG